MKHLKKHPKQQRMEDMTFPLQKGDYTGGVHKKRSGNTLKPSDFSSDRYEDMTFPLHKEKVIWEGREWLRLINDDRHGWHVLAWVILGVAIIISLKMFL